jgi:hypothetical protein
MDDLTPRQMAVLNEMSDTHAVTAAQIAADIGWDRSTVNNERHKLVGLGYAVGPVALYDEDTGKLCGRGFLLTKKGAETRAAYRKTIIQ